MSTRTKITMFMTWVAAAALSYLAAAGCHPNPPAPPPQPDADAGQEEDAGPDGSSRYARACEALRAAGCPEGVDPECAAVLARGDKVLNMRPACLAGAKSAAEARACGSVRCVK